MLTLVSILVGVYGLYHGLTERHRFKKEMSPNLYHAINLMKSAIPCFLAARLLENVYLTVPFGLILIGLFEVGIGQFKNREYTWFGIRMQGWYSYVALIVGIIWIYFN